MQKDFHHATTYVLARLAGFDHPEADVIAYASQYVDDATNTGVIHFTDGSMYEHISSAHKTFDYKNFDELANHQAWLPFHFLPGNNEANAGQNPLDTFMDKIVCKPDSPIARDMVAACIHSKNSPHALQRLGITLHVYSDTWSHQGFAGVNHKNNDISKLNDEDNPGNYLAARLKDFFGDAFDDVASKLVGDTLPLGHGAALSYPDRPYLKWSYKDHHKNKVVRDNAAIFLQAAEKMVIAMQRFRLGDANADVPGLQATDKARIEALFRNIKHEEENARHQAWLDRIATGYFNFPPVNLTYVAKGPGSWKHKALGTIRVADDKSEKFELKPDFLTSHWKLFHDALQVHRFYVIHELLPRYGICAA